ncbi:MAG: hypothetical protein Q8N26_28845 [Myxococcales bacterium]|nr:hypothetical protein [Myxococcales bacterium]
MRRLWWLLVPVALAGMDGQGCGAPPMPVPFNPVGCEPPTWEQCATPVTPCDFHFREQARTESRSACNLLFEQKAAAEATRYPEREVLVPPLSRVNGLQKPPTVPTKVARAVPVNRSDFSFTGLNGLALGESFRDAALLPKSSTASVDRRLLLTNTRKQWEDNGHKVMSCREYVHERYYDYTVFEDRLRFGGFDDHRRVFDVAYSQATPAPRWAIGTRHLNDPQLRGRDERPFGTLPFASKPMPKNQYFTVPAPQPSTRITFVAGVDDRIIYLPESQNVVIRLGKLSNVGRNALNYRGVALNDATLATTIEGGRAFYAESWAWHREMAQRNAGVLDEVLFGWDRKQDDFLALLAERERLEQTILSLLDPAAAGKIPVVGGQQLAQKWWLDPVWNPSPASLSAAGRKGVDIRDVSLGGLANLNVLTNHPGATGIVTFAGGNPAGADAPSVKPGLKNQVTAACSGNPVICAAYKLAALDGVIEEELVKAQQAGCLDLTNTTDPALCDWSPRRFSQSVLGHFTDEREATFQKCREYVEDFTELQNKTLSFTNPDTLESFSAQGDYTVSGVALEKYYSDVNQYLNVVGGYLGPLLDRKSGKVRLKREVGDEAEFGGSLFGAKFSYGLAFEALDVGNANTCNLTQRVAATMAIDAKLLGANIEVLDTRAAVADSTATLSAKVLGVELVSGLNNVPVGEMTVLRDTKEKRQTFFDHEYLIVIGFVPITLGGALVGSIGLDYSLEAGKKTVMSGGCQLERSGVTGTLTPFAWVQAQVWAGVDAVVAEAGIKGILTIVLVQLPMRADVGIGPSAANPAALDLTLNVGGDLVLTFFSGSINVYLEVGICPLCTSFEEPLVAWDGLKQKVPLFKTTATVRLADLRLLVNREGEVP